MKIAGKITRDVRLFERQWPWAVLTGVLALAFAGLVGLAATGFIEHFDPVVWGRNIRGYTGLGFFFGIFAVALSALTFFYSLRKRALQERMPFFKGTMMSWLSLHVWLGLLAFVCVVFHAGFGLVSVSLTSGKLLFGVFALLALTGVVWRIVYSVVPSSAAPQIGNYSQLGSAKRAAEQSTEIEKIAAGKSAEFRRIKDWMLAAERAPHEVAQAAATVKPEERAELDEVYALAAKRNRALVRRELQGKYTRILQGWRVLHVPLTFAFLVLLVVHVFGALDWHARALRQLPVNAIQTGSLSGFESSADCRSCHTAIYDEWKTSMHAHALTSPVTIAQANQDAKVTLAHAADPDPKMVCVNCHAPVAALLTKTNTLPLPGEGMNDGVSCTSCHQFAGSDPKGGSAGLTAWQRDLERGHRYFGPIADPVGNSFHSSEDTGTFGTPSNLCNSCHDVNFDANGDGKILRGDDLVLQTTHDEFLEYQAGGGKESCVSCHMPIAKRTRAAEGARIPFDQDFDAPDRAVREHTFVGVDYPLDEVAKSDPNKSKRDALLKSAAALRISSAPAIANDAVTFAISVANTGSGHYLPTGFAFARQLWIEVKIVDGRGAILFESGLLAKNTDDLCDASSMSETANPMQAQIKGCAAADPQLVNFQQKLLDHVELARDKNGAPIRLDDHGNRKLAQPANGKETWLQHLTGGVVTRVRPSDTQGLSPIPPRTTRTFAYKVPLSGRAIGDGALTIRARLLFRNLPPAMLRALSANQPKEELPQIGPLIANLQIVEMASQSEKFDLRGR